ncbi:peptidylprolyl isomerase [Patescibacteria group bacterium]|nr:peptidylprolyl isomerase [Patescibacteria group bacterium]
MEEEQKKESDKKTLSKGSKIAIAVVVVLIIVTLILGGVFALGIYTFSWDNKITSSVIEQINLPIAKVNGSYVPMTQYKSNFSALKKYSDSQTQLQGEEVEAPKDSEIKASVLNRMLEDEIVKQLSAKHDVLVSDEEIEEEFNKVKELAGEDAEIETQINELYGWTLDEFKNQALRTSLQEGKLQKVFFENEEVAVDFKGSEKEAEDKANKALEEINNGRDFAEIASEQSDDPGSKEKGGELGFFTKGQMVKEFEDAAFTLEAGQVFEGAVKTAYGYHLIKVEEVEGEGDEKKVKARHILYAVENNFVGWVLDEKKKAKVSILEKELKWDTEKGEVVVK